MSAEPDVGPVVLCYDGSEGSAHAIQTAAALSIQGHALVCHTWAGLSNVMFRGTLDPAPAPLAKAIDDLDRLDREEAERRAGEGAALARRAGFDAVPLAVKERRKTWRTLVETAAEHRARLTVIGAHGCSGVSRAVLGSVSSSVLTHSQTPVLVVPDAGPEQLERKSLLLCYDGSEGARRAIELAGELFPGRHATVVALWQSWVEHAPKLGAVGPVAGMRAELDEIAEMQAQETAAEGVAVALEAGLVADPLPSRVTGAPIWRGVIDAARERGAAAIVMGSRGLTGISSALGSVSHGVVHHSHRPVLVVPPAPA